MRAGVLWGCTFEPHVQDLELNGDLHLVIAAAAAAAAAKGDDRAVGGLDEADRYVAMLTALQQRLCRNHVRLRVQRL